MGRRKKTGTFEDWFSSYAQQNGIDASVARNPIETNTGSYKNSQPAQKSKTISFNDWFSDYAQQNGIDPGISQKPTYTQTNQQTQKPSYIPPTYMPTNQQSQKSSDPLRNAANRYVINNQNGYVTGSARGDQQYQNDLQKMAQQYASELQNRNTNDPFVKSKQKEIEDLQNQIINMGRKGNVADLMRIQELGKQQAEKSGELSQYRSALQSSYDFDPHHAYLDSMDNETLTAYQERVRQQGKAAEKKLADASTGGIDWMARNQYMNDIDSTRRELNLVQNILDTRNWNNKYQDYMNLRNQAGFDGSYQSTYKDTGEQIDPRGSLNGAGDYIQSEMSKYGDITYDYLNNDPNAMKVMHTMNPYGFRTGDGAINSYYAWLNDDEKQVFNHLYKQSPEKAYEFMDFMQSELEKRERSKNEEYMEALADKDPVGMSMLSVSSALGAPIATASQIGSLIKDGEFNANAWGNQFSYIPTAIRKRVSENIAEKSELGSILYNTGMSMADNFAQMVMTGGTSQAAVLLMMGTKVFADTVTEGVDQGKDSGEILLDAFVRSGIEVLTEKIGLDEVFDFIGGTRSIEQLLKSAAAEGGEEGLSDILNLMWDYSRQATTGKEAELTTKYNQYRMQGFSEKEAKKKVVEEFLGQLSTDVFGGALSGFVMSGGGAAVNDSITGANYRKIGKEVKNYYDTVDETNASDTRRFDKEVYSKLSDKEAGKLYSERASVEKETAEAKNVLKGAVETIGDNGYADYNAVQEVLDNDQARSILETETSVEEIKNGGDVQKALAEYAPALQAEEEKAKENLPLAERIANAQAELRNQKTMLPLRMYSEAQMTEENERNYIDKIARDRFGATGYEVYISALQNNGVKDINGRIETLRDFTKAYNAGMNNQILPEGLLLSETSAKAAYESGKNAILGQYRDENGKLKKGFTSYHGKEAGLVIDSDIARKAIAEGRISEKDLTGFSELAVALGTKLIPEEHMPENGWYEDGGIGFSLDADNGVKHVLSHELGHRLQEVAPKEYELFKNLVADYMGPEELEKALSRYYNLGKAHGLTYSQTVAMNEVVVDWLADHIDSGDLEWSGFVARASQTNEGRSLLTRIRDFFRRIVSKLRGSKNPEIIQLSESMKEAQELLDSVVKVATEKISMRDRDGFGRIYIDRFSAQRTPLINAKIVSLNERGKYTSITRAEVDQYEVPSSKTSKDGKNYLKNIITNAFGKDNVTFDINGNQITAYLTREGKVHFNTFNDLSSENAAIGARIKEIVRNSEYVFSNPHDSHTKTEGVTEWDKFVSVVKIADEDYTVILSLRKVDSDLRHQLYAISTKKEGTGQIADAGSRNPRIADYMAFSPSSDNMITRSEEESKQFSLRDDVKQKLMEHGVFASDGSVAKFSLRSWDATDKNSLRQSLLDAGFHLKEINKWIKDVNGVAATVLADRTRLDYDADEYQAALKPNAEYYYTLDLSTLCKKRLLYQGTYNAIMHQLVNKALMPEDTIKLRRMMDDMGYEVPCGICYEESRKKNEGKFAERWLEGHEGWKGYRNQKHDDPYIPTLDQVTTTDGRAWLQKNHPEAYDSYIEYQKGRGSANPKVSFTHTDYRGDILRMTKTDIANVKHIGGLRIQSFSDFETVHVIDMMQAVMDMASKNLTAQAYTKVPAFADIFGGTGIKINLSLIGKAVNGKLVFDAKEGIDPKEAFRIRNKYSENVGTIIVGANDESILAAWADPKIDMVIPFHRSGWSGAEFEKLGLKDYQDYTEQQTEVYIFDDGSTMSLDKASKKLGLKGDQKLEGIYSEDYWDYSKSGKENAEAYLKLCAEKHYRPVFYKFLTDNGDGTWSLPADGSADGYWKSLTDYKMYNNDGVGAKQQEVKPVFDMRAANKAMREYDGNPNTLPVAQDVVNKFVEEYKADPIADLPKASRETSPGNAVRYSLRDSSGFYSQLERQVDAFKGDKIGASSLIPYLKGKGVKDEEIKWTGLATFLEGKKSVSKEDVLQYVRDNQLEITESVLTDTPSSPIWKNPYGAEVNADYFYDSTGSGREVAFKNENEFRTEALRRAKNSGYSEDEVSIEFAPEYGYALAETEDEVLIEAYKPDPYQLMESEFTNDTMSRWDAYKLDGGSNYREILFQLPNSDYSNSAMTVHWGSNNRGVLVHARVQDFDTEDGKVLFVEEIQSDWHNAGQKSGYVDESLSIKNADLVLDGGMYKLYVNGQWTGHGTNEATVKAKGFEKIKSDLFNRYASLQADRLVPDAPFKNNYTDFALKSLLRMAAEGDYDYLSWASGEMQEDRWSSEYAEGYRIEYDQDIPKFLKKYGKQWGANLTEIRIKEGDSQFDNEWPVQAIPVNAEMKESVITKGQPRFSLRSDSEGRKLSKGQQEYFKDSKILDEDGNLRVVYHGSSEAFNTFDISKGRSGMDIQGSFFSPWEIDAAGYGENVRAYYLNITNPAPEQVGYQALRRFQGQNYAGTKAREYLESLGYDGVNNGDEEYIAFYPEQIKLVDNQNPTNDKDVRYSLRNDGYNVNGATARWTDDRIDSLIHEYGASNPDYSQAYAALMNPRDYLKLTLSDDMLDRWNSGSNMPEHPETYSLDEDRLRENTQTPFLSIYSKDGTEVQGHEGRHRMRALLEAGITSVPVVIRDTDTKYSKQTLESMTLTAQDFGEGPVNNGAEVILTNLVPIKETNRDELTRLFGGNADVQFSLRGSRDIVAASERDSRIRSEYMEAASVWRNNMTAISDFGKSGFNTNMAALIRDYNKNIDKNTSERIVGEIRSLTREMVRNKDMTYSDIQDKANVIAAKILWGESDAKKFPTRGLVVSDDTVRAVDDIRNDIMAQILKSTTRGEGKYQALSKEFADYRKRANERITEVRRKRDAKLEEIQVKKREEIARKIDSSERTTLLKRMNRLNKLMKTTSEANQEMIKDFIGEFNLVAKSMTAGKAENLADLSDYIDNMMRIDPDFMPTERTIKDVARLGKKNVADLTIEEVAQLNEALLNLENAIRTSKKLIDSEYKQHISELGNEIIEGVRNTKGIGNGKIGVFNWFQQAYDKTLATPVIRPETEILRLVGFDRNNPLYKLTFGDEGSLASGQRDMVRYKWQANKRYTDRFVNDKKFADTIMGKHARACEITGRRADGTVVTLKVTPDMLMALYMHAQNKHNFRHFGEWNDESGHTQHGGGITIPDFDLYRKGKIKEAYRVGTRDGNLITMTRSALNAAFKQLTEKEMAFIKSAQAYYSEMSQPEINRVSNLLLGYSIAQEENYFRINTDSNYRGTNMDAIKFDGTIEGMGWTKERIEGARNAILLIPLTEQFQRDIDAHSKYVGMAIPVRNFNKAYGVNRQSYDENGDFTGTETSVQSAITGKWGSGATDYMQKLMSDIQNPRTTSESWAKIFGKLRSYYAGSVLALNAGVAIKQAASYPTAAAEIGWLPLIKAFGNTRLQGKLDMDIVNKYSPLMYLRTQGIGYQELADLKNLNKGWLNRALNSKALNWINDMDVMTIKKLWKASEYYVRDNFKDLKVGSEEYYKKVGEVHSRVIERTQPNYTTLQRGEILRSDSDFIRMALGMFKTQPFQNASILFEATGELQAACRAYKVAPNEVTEAMRKAAIKKMARAVSSQLVSSLVFAIMAAAWDWIRGRDDKYKDKDGKITFASAFKQIGINMGSNAFGMIPLGSVIYEVTETTIDTFVTSGGGEAIFNATAYGLDASTATGIVNDIVDAIGTLTRNTTSIDLDSKNTTEQHIRGYVDILSSVAQAFGYPADNFVKDGQAIAVNVFRTLGVTGQMTRYEQEFYAKRVFTAVSKDKKGYLEILYNAYDNDRDAYNKLYSIYIENDGFATSTKTSKEYIDSKMDSYIKDQTKNQNRDKAGLTESQLSDYQEALNRFDTDHNNKFTQEETYNALMSIALSQKQKETLWNERGWKKSFSEYGSKKK